MTEEEARLETAHMSVADRVAVDDLSLSHVLAHFACLVLVNERGKRPVVLWNFTIVCLSRDQRCSDCLEGVIECLVIQKDPIVIVVSVEPIFNLADRSGDVPDV